LVWACVSLLVLAPAEERRDTYASDRLTLLCFIKYSID
jgi:hypothetical protein